MLATRITACRSCSHAHLELILSLGTIPLANALLSKDDLARPEERYPLDLAFCARCSLVQILDTVPPEKLFREYLYFSSFSDTMLGHAQDHVSRLVDMQRLGPESLAVEIASNDGYLLQYFVKAGVPVLGIEPARNIAKVAQDKGVRTVSEFFGRELAATLPKADVVIANNVLAHVADLNGFVAGIKTILKPEGVATIEVPYVKEVVDRCEFDTIYHEHLSYLSLRPVERLCAERGFRLVDVEPVELHGGSILLHICREDALQRPSEQVEMMVREEDARGLARAETLAAFAERVRAWKGRFEEFIGSLRQSEADVIGYGAAAKANILLNYCPEAAKALRLILDKNPLKHGRYTPGTHIPVQLVEGWESDPATHLLILAWNFRDEIMRQMKPFANRGGRFVIPIPEPEII